MSWSTSGYNYRGTPAYSNGVVYALSAGTLQAVDAATGTWQWSFVGDTMLWYPPVIANGHLYVSSSDNVYAVDLASQTEAWTAAARGWIAVADGRLYLSGQDGVLRAYLLQ
ncbi:MAG: PQQ-binding-like beta-propeller repeat protein [Planctomycetota bacterium]|nr:PQQ-binding-like beta-propeller repeat protein [Planctomycetota bacterium]